MGEETRYAVFMDGRYWESYRAKSNAKAERDMLKKAFGDKIKLEIKKVTVTAP